MTRGRALASAETVRLPDAARETAALVIAAQRATVLPTAQGMHAEPGPMIEQRVRAADPLRRVTASANNVARRLRKPAREMAVAIVPTGRRRDEAQTIAAREIVGKTIAVRVANVAPMSRASMAAAAQATRLVIVLRVVSVAGHRRHLATVSADSAEGHLRKTVLEMAVATKRMVRRRGGARKIAALVIAVHEANDSRMARRTMYVAAAAMTREANRRVVSAAALRRSETAAANSAERGLVKTAQRTAPPKLAIRRLRTAPVDFPAQGQRPRHSLPTAPGGRFWCRS